MLDRSWIIALLLGVGILAASEVGLRVLTDRSSRWNVRLGANKQYDPVTFFRNKPNYDLGGGVVTNEFGYRAPRNLTLGKPPGQLRIIYLGDSNTVTPRLGNYPFQVEARLERDLGLEVESINTAVAGFSSENARILFETEVSRFDADYFFVYLGWNDLGQFGPEGLAYKRSRQGYEISPLQKVLSEVYSLRFLYAAQRVLRHRREAVAVPMSREDQALYDRYEPTHFYANMRAILRLAKERYPHVYVMSLATLTSEQPTPEELAKAHFPTGMDKNMLKLHRLVGSYNEAVRALGRELNVPLIELDRLFDSREARREFTDSCHMGPSGAGMIAASIVREIARNEAGPTGPTRAHAAEAGGS